MPAEQEQTLVPDKTAMRAHLAHLFGAIPAAFRDGLVEIAHTDMEGAIRHARLFRLDELDDAVEFAAAVNDGDGFSVYVGAALRKPTTKRNGRCGEKDFYAATSLWADLDDEEPVKAAGGRCAAAMPTFVLYSGRHPHMRTQLFWRLAEPITVANDLRAALTAICTHLDGDEKVAEPARVMRLAGSIAWPHKAGRIPEMTGTLRIKNPGPDSYALQDIITAYVSPTNVLDFNEARKHKAAEPAATTNAWGKAWDGREDAMTRFVWRVVVELYRDAPIKPSDSVSQEAMETAWREFARTITTKEPGHTLEDEGRGETMFAQKWRYAMRHWDDKVADHAKVPPPGDPLQDDGISRPEQPEPDFTAAPAAGGVARFPFDTIDDLFGLPPARWLVPKWIPEGGIGILYGKWGSFKSFIALDLGLHLACGLDSWHGVELPEGGCEVLIIAREGGSGFTNRIRAFMHRHCVTHRTHRIRFMRAGVNFMNDQDFGLLVDAIRVNGSPWRLVIVDTVARVIPGVEMSKPEVITKFMERCQQIGEATNGAAVVGVHHQNKTGQIMGSVYFEANADFVFAIEKDDEGEQLEATIKCTKMKDGEDGWDEPVALAKYAASFGESSLAVVSVGTEGNRRQAKKSEGMPSRDTVKKMLGIISDRWDRGKPLSMAPQSREQGRYAPRVLSRVAGGSEKRTEDTLNTLIDNEVLAVVMFSTDSKMKGLKVVGNVDY